MTDDRKRRGRFMGDAERAVIGRTRTQPAQNWDDDVTPPPQAPPSIEGLELREQMQILGDGVEQAITGLGKLWEERGNGERLSKVETALTGYTAQLARQQETLDGLLVPSVKSLLAAADSMGRAQVRTDAQMERSAELLENIAATLKDVVTRIGRLENTVERLNHSDQALAAQVQATNAMMNAIDTRLTFVERKLADEKLVETTALAERKKLFTWARAGLVTAGGGIAWLAAHLPDWFGR